MEQSFGVEQNKDTIRRSGIPYKEVKHDHSEWTSLVIDSRYAYMIIGIEDTFIDERACLLLGELLRSGLTSTEITERMKVYNTATGHSGRNFIFGGPCDNS